ncbi:MAG: tetratricopeptide repeat protein [Pseudomonadota bacterium]
MSDDSFIREVNEELRSEKTKEFWSRYGTIIIALAAAIVIGVGVWRFTEYREATAAAEQGDAFMAAVTLAEEGKTDEAIAALEQLEEQHGGAYGAMAQLRAASELVKQDKKKEAVAAYDVVIADNSADENLRSIARLRAGYLMVDVGSVEDVSSRVTPLSAPGAPYRASALEALGLAHFKAGDLERAFAHFEAIANDATAPASIGQRVTIMLDVIAARGGPVRGQAAAQ